VHHVYRSAGRYRITLKVRDRSGHSTTVSVIVRVRR
jgi:hypothetical protein